MITFTYIIYNIHAYSISYRVIIFHYITLYIDQDNIDYINYTVLLHLTLQYIKLSISCCIKAYIHPEQTHTRKNTLQAEKVRYPLERIDNPSIRPIYPHISDKWYLVEHLTNPHPKYSNTLFSILSAHMLIL